jgi:serine/threonine-protein kinase
MPPPLRHFLAELRRRKVYRAAIVYAAAAFVIWQVADLAFPYLGLPDTAVTLVLALTILGFPVALVLAWAYELRPEDSVVADVPTEESARAARADAFLAHPTTTEPDPRADIARGTIAVLPFENMSPEPESEYFADGISEELTHALARVQRLRVAARTSAFAFKGQRLDVREIGTRLGVSHVVEGSVRRAGDRLRVTAQLIDAANGYHVWSDRFEREMDDVFTIQDEIVSAVVGSLLPRFEQGPGSPAVVGDEPMRPLVLPRTQDLDAYDQYLRGRHELTRFDGTAVTAAVRFFESSIELDPGFAPALAGLAEALTMQAIGFTQGSAGELLPRARQAADRALALDPSLPAAHVARGLSLLYHDWQFRQARSELERAVELSPSFVDAHRWLEFYWTYVENDIEQALAALASARQIDPLDPRIAVREATVKYLFRRYDEAEAMFEDMRRTDPHAWIFVLGLLDTLVRQPTRIQDALALAREMPLTKESPETVLGVTGLVLGVGGDSEAARATLALLESRKESASPFWRAVLHLALGELDEAFALWEDAFERRDGSLLYLSVIPWVNGVREDPRYASILRRMGLGHLVARWERADG